MDRSETYAGTSYAIDALPPSEALATMLSAHSDAIAGVAKALADIDTAAGIIAAALSSGARLYYAAAGSSGLMALADACELPGTFGVDGDQIRICMAGGVPVDGSMPGNTEDDSDQAQNAAKELRAGDVAIVVSASGTTPFALAFAETARQQGASVISIANVSGSALLGLGDVAIAVPTGPEVISGSTRLGAGTAQKVALNMISTQVGILLGHVHDGLMVNLVADNIKLRQRAAGIVKQIGGVDQDVAEQALIKADSNTKLAVLIARGIPIDHARALLNTHNGRLRNCLKPTEREPKSTN
ncbi:MAG: N-acetylmuramic acid 6-phosphate etherase [Pseudomonadota bacterium]